MTGRLMSIELWDGRYWPGWIDHGTPTFQYKCAPDGLLTRRQLRNAGLAPGGQEPWAQLVWRRDRRRAWLFRIDLARPKRAATPAQLVAIEAALAARRVCAICGPVDHTVRTTDRLCGDCYAAIHAGQAHQSDSRISKPLKETPR